MTGLLRDANHFYQWENGPKVPGVTSVMKMLDKSAPLVGWAKREVALAAVRNMDTVRTIAETAGANAAANYLKEIPGYQRDTSADLGTRVHSAAEAIAKGQEPLLDDEVHGFVTSYRRDFLDKYRPEFRQVEFMVYSEEHEYGGTGDAICSIDGELWLLDYKTSKNVYSETALQLAALRWADFVGLPGDPVKYGIPKCTRFGVVHVRPEGAKLVEYAVTREHDFFAFLACRRLWTWVNERAETIRRAA